MIGRYCGRDEYQKYQSIDPLLVHSYNSTSISYDGWYHTQTQYTLIQVVAVFLPAV